MDMECFKCSKKASINLRHIGKLCSKCFLEIVEKRVRKELRTKRLIKKNDKILLINNGSKEFFVGCFLLKSIIKNLPVEISTKKSKNLILSQKTAKKYNKVIIPWSLDDEIEEFIGYLFDKKAKTKFSKKSIKLLKSLSEREIGLFAKAKKIKYKKRKKSGIKLMLDKLEQRYPGYKFSLLNSSKKMQNI